jgi:ureidoacrylate peracid hydrolase
MTSPRLDPRRTALIVVDMQHAFIRDEGSMRKLGLNNDLLKPTVEPVARVVAAARRAGLPIIFTRMAMRPDYKDAGLRKARFAEAQRIRSLVQGTWDVEIIDELKPEREDYVVDKTRHSAFYNTNLEVILRGEGVDTVIVCGVTTEMCVESTIRDAYARDYRIVVPADAVAAFDVERHEGALKIIGWGYGTLVTTADLAAALLPAPMPAS